MTLTEALEFLVDYVVDDGFDAAELIDDLWHSPDFLADWEAVMVDAIARGKLSQTYWNDVCNGIRLSNFLHSFAQLWDALTKAGVVYPLKETVPYSAASTTIWAYVEYWQSDTEWWSTNPAQMQVLLEAAVDPHCPKRMDCLEGIVHILRRLAASNQTERNTQAEEERYAKGRHERSRLPEGIHSIDGVGTYWIIALSNSTRIFQVHSNGGWIRSGTRLDNRILLD